MTRFKNLSLLLIPALFAASALPATADVAMELSTHKSYRQNKTTNVNFRGGTFEIAVRDGNGIVVAGCARPFYWPPNQPLDPCPGGSTAYVTFGSIDAEANSRVPYLWMTDVIPAIVIAPRHPELCILRAAPYSKLPRPSADMSDNSFGVYYNLHTTDIREYWISRYFSERTYTAAQRNKFESEIVPGVYHYIFPRLDNINLIAPIPATIYEMPEGYTKKSNVKFGVRFNTKVRWTYGFMELSYNKPNVIEWSGFKRTNTFASVDKLYFSMRFMRDPSNPNSDTINFNPETGEAPASFFPGFVNGGDPRVLLTSPYVSSFTLPPIFEGGSKSVIELELDRNFQTGGVTYDFSTRKFQIPSIVINRYTEYAEGRFGLVGGRTYGLLGDPDGDGVNNMNEWILDSRADDSTSVPLPPFPTLVPPVLDVFGFVIEPSYFGFRIQKKQATRPPVWYILQRSTDNGRTWRKMVSDANWTVVTNKDEVAIYSNTDNGAFPPVPTQPPGTAGDIYRLKIIVARTKKK